MEVVAGLRRWYQKDIWKWEKVEHGWGDKRAFAGAPEAHGRLLEAEIEIEVEIEMIEIERDRDRYPIIHCSWEHKMAQLLWKTV